MASFEATTAALTRSTQNYPTHLQAELESLDPVGRLGVNVTSAGLGMQYEKMWRVSFVGSTVEGDVEALQVNPTACTRNRKDMRSRKIP